MGIDEIIKVIPSYLGAATAIIGTWLAMKNFNRWRTEMLAKQSFETARRLMLGVFTVEHQVSESRVIFNAKGAEPAMSKIVDAIKDFQITLLEAKVIWGAEKLDPLSIELIQKAYRMRGAMLTSARYHNANPQRPISERQQEIWAEAENLIYGDGSNPDKFDAVMSESVIKFQRFLQPHLPGQQVESWSEKFNKFANRIEQIKNTIEGTDDFS